MDRHLLLSSLLWRTERLFHDKQVITRLDEGEYQTYTYREYAQRVRKLANALGRLGLRHGDRVAHWPGTTTGTWRRTSPCRASAPCCTR